MAKRLIAVDEDLIEKLRLTIDSDTKVRSIITLSDEALVAAAIIRQLQIMGIDSQ